MGQAGVIAPRPGVIPTRMDRSPGVIPGWTGRLRSDRKRVDGRGEFYGRLAGETAALRTGLGADRRRPATARTQTGTRFDDSRVAPDDSRLGPACGP